MRKTRIASRCARTRQRATTGQKEPAPTWLILGTFLTPTRTKLRQMNSCQFRVFESAIEMLEYKGCALAIGVATEEVGLNVHDKVGAAIAPISGKKTRLGLVTAIGWHCTAGKEKSSHSVAKNQ